MVDLIERVFGEEPDGECSGECITGPDSIANLGGDTGVVIDFGIGEDQAAVGAAGEGDTVELVVYCELAKLVFRGAFQFEDGSQHGEFGIIDFEDVGELERFMDDLPGEVILTQVDIENPECGCGGRLDEIEQ